MKILIATILLMLFTSFSLGQTPATPGPVGRPLPGAAPTPLRDPLTSNTPKLRGHKGKKNFRRKLQRTCEKNHSKDQCSKWLQECKKKNQDEEIQNCMQQRGALSE